MKIFTILGFIGITILLVIPQAIILTPAARTRSGTITLSASGFTVKSIDSVADRVVVVQFSAETSAIEFFVIHSDYYNLTGLPNVVLCQYHTIAKSGSCQFSVDTADTWYLVFANSAQSQQISYQWIEYTTIEWGTRQAIIMAVIVGCIAVVSVIGIKAIRARHSTQ